MIAAILIAARKSAYGSEYRFKNICSSCATINEIEVSIDDVKVKELKLHNKNIGLSISPFNLLKVNYSMATSNKFGFSTSASVYEGFTSFSLQYRASFRNKHQ